MTDLQPIITLFTVWIIFVLVFTYLKLGELEREIDKILSTLKEEEKPSPEGKS